MIKDMVKGLCTVALPPAPDVPIVVPCLSEGLKGDKFPKLVRDYRIPQQPFANPPKAYMAKKGAKDKGGKQTSKAQTPKGETKSESKAKSRESSAKAPCRQRP